MQVVEPVISAIDVAVDIAAMERGVAHEHFHVADPAIADVEGIAGTIGSVRLVGGNGHPIEIVVGAAAQLQEVELIVVGLGAVGFIGKDRIAKFRCTVFRAEIKTPVVLGRAGAGTSDDLDAGIDLETRFGAVVADELHRHFLFGGADSA